VNSYLNASIAKLSKCNLLQTPQTSLLLACSLTLLSIYKSYCIGAWIQCLLVISNGSEQKVQQLRRGQRKLQRFIGCKQRHTETKTERVSERAIEINFVSSHL